jgi:hypothetical protein
MNTYIGFFSAWSDLKNREESMAIESQFGMGGK